MVSGGIRTEEASGCLHGEGAGLAEVGLAPVADTDILQQTEPQRVCIGKAFPKQHPDPKALCLDMFSDPRGDGGDRMVGFASPRAAMWARLDRCGTWE